MATIKPSGSFDAEEAAKSLRTAMKGLGTDEDAIIEVLTEHTNAQRQEISSTFKTMYGKDLLEEIKSEIGGKFEKVIVGLMTPARRYDADLLRAAMKGAGTDEDVLIEILCSRDNEEMEEIKRIYSEELERDLEEDVKNDTSGYFKRLLVSQINAGREQDGELDYDKAKEEAQEIYDAGEGQWGTDESTIMMILSLRSYTQLKATFKEYEKISEKDIEEVIESETSGSLKAGLLAIVRYAKDPAVYFAKQLYNSMKGLGTDDDALVRIMVTRSEVDLAKIKVAFEEKYGDSLADFIKGDTRGDYEKVLLAILK